ncbi:MAG: DUF4783 domain-containing protein [Bacteroidota bacterium]
MVFSFQAFARTIQIPPDIINAFNEGDSKRLIQYCKNQLDLVITNQERSLCNKSEGARLLENFFNTNVPIKFDIKHQGGEGNAVFVIGQLITSNGNYRITLFIEKSSNDFKISQLRIKRE